MNELAKNVWAFFLVSLVFGIWTIPMLLGWAVFCYIYHYRRIK